MGLRVPPVFPVSVAIVEVFGVCCWEAESPRLFVEPGFFRTLDLHDHAVLNYCKYRAKSQSLEGLADPGEGGFLRDRIRRTGGGSVVAAWAA
jgi:hypothetical protein